MRKLALACLLLLAPARAWAVIAFVASASSSGNPTTSHTVTIPASTFQDDILILLSVHNGTGTLTVVDNDTGGNTWTLKDERDFGTPNASSQLRWKRATTATASKTITVSVATNCSSSVLLVYRGVETSGDPIEAVLSESNISGNETQAQITTLTNGAVVLLGVSQSPGVATATQSTTSPGTLLERAETISTGGTDCSCSLADGTKATAGVTGSFTWTQTNTVSGSVGFALKPSADPAGQQFVFPVDGWVVGTIQYPEGAQHPQGSADISCTAWTKVVAARSGTVSQVTQNTDGSWFVVLDHTLSYQTLYGHWAENQKPDIQVGQLVAAGEEIGYMGRSGVAINPHLHFCVALGGIPVQPNPCLPLNINSGDWVERGTHVQQDFTTLAQIPEKPDTVILDVIEDADAFTAADETSAVVTTIPRGSVFVRDQSESGFYRGFWAPAGQFVWLPTSVLLPRPLGHDGYWGVFGGRAYGEVPLGSLSRSSFQSGFLEHRKVWPAVIDARTRSASTAPVMWQIPIDTPVTVYDDPGDGWIKVLDSRFPNPILIPGTSVSSIFVWVLKAGTIKTEEFEASVGSRDVDVREAPSPSATLLGTLHVDEPTRLKWTPFLTDPAATTVSRYTTVPVLGTYRGWYQIYWPSASGSAAWTPGWKWMGRR